VDDTGDPGGQVSAEHEVLEAHRALILAYETSDHGAFLDLLLPSEDLLIFHPTLEDRFEGIEEAREEVGRMFGRYDELTWTEAHPELIVRGEVAWVTSHVLVESPDLEHPFVGRASEVWVRHNDEWRLAHGHWSQQPELAEETEPEA
jgi:ketosteroid isomerase-like protein